MHLLNPRERWHSYDKDPSLCFWGSSKVLGNPSPPPKTRTDNLSLGDCLAAVPLAVQELRQWDG